MQEVHKSTKKKTNKISQNKSRDFDIVVRDIHTLMRITDIVNVTLLLLSLLDGFFEIII